MGEVEAAPGILLQFLSGREGWTATSVVSRDAGLEVRMSIAGTSADSHWSSLVLLSVRTNRRSPWIRRISKTGPQCWVRG